MTRNGSDKDSKRLLRRGRPSTLPAIEARLGLPIEHHVMGEMAKDRSIKQIAAALRIGDRTLRYHLRKRGYRVDQQTKLVLIDRPPRPERRNGAARQLARPG